MPTHFVSVIIPVLNDPERLKQCLQALDAQTYSRHSYEVIVVDNGSDECIESVVAEFRQARASYEPCSGSYAARNTGLSQAQGEILAFTDADCIPASDWIENGVLHLTRIPRCGLVAGKIHIFPRDPDNPTAVELYECRTYLSQKEYVEVGRFGATANLFTFREVFQHVGPFVGTVKSGGDMEWGQRVASYGYRLVFAEDTCVAHPARCSLGELYQRVSRIVGGLHDLNQTRAGRHVRHNGFIGKGFWIDALPPIRASFQDLRDPRIQLFSHKLKIIAIRFFVQYAQVWETIRLKLGMRP